MHKPVLQKQTQDKATVLVVDDEVFNLEIIADMLEDTCVVVTAENGMQARDMLVENPRRYHAVLLDRMMPGMDGMEVLAFMRNDPVLGRVPVIMQTAKATKKDIQEGLDAGVLYYITKPFSKGTLLSIVNSAVAGAKAGIELGDAAAYQKDRPEGGQFIIQTMEEAYNLAVLLASICPDSEAAVTGLAELLINSVEHGNLGIEFEDKTLLLKNDTWINEIERRLLLPEYSDKKVTVTLDVNEEYISFLISDDGGGFDSSKYMTITPERAAASHGRGIAMARMISFDELEYREGGSTVYATIKKGNINCE